MSADERIGSESRGRLVADLALLSGRLALGRRRESATSFLQNGWRERAGGDHEAIDRRQRRHAEESSQWWHEHRRQLGAEAGEHDGADLRARGRVAVAVER